jgi:hypothetical protein
MKVYKQKMQFRLGVGLARIIPFYNRQDEPIISNKMLYIFGIIAVIKVIILLTWR